MQTQTRQPISEELFKEKNLPPIVQRYLRYSNVIGQSWINTVKLQYQGEFRLGKDKPWMPMRGEQVYTTTPPAFQWNARFKMFGLPILAAKDTYKDGSGHMFGKITGLFTVFDVRDTDELLQGTMMRYLQEMMWFPTAFLGEDITWSEVDDHSADVTFTHNGKSVTGRMFFDDQGRLLNFLAERYREIDGSYQLDYWSTPITEYGTYKGFNIPQSGWGVWQLPEGDLAYVKLTLTAVDYNTAVRFDM